MRYHARFRILGTDEDHGTGDGFETFAEAKRSAVAEHNSTKSRIHIYYVRDVVENKDYEID